jgi:hypothetical protein
MNPTDFTVGPSLPELQALLDQRTLIENRWWKGATIKLDGYHLKHCLFEDCTLWYVTPDFVLTDCEFAGKVSVTQRPAPEPT